MNSKRTAIGIGVGSVIIAISTVSLFLNFGLQTIELDETFGEPFPSPQEGEATMTENLALRTVHDLIPGKIKVDGKMTPILDSSLSGKKLSD